MMTSFGPINAYPGKGTRYRVNGSNGQYYPVTCTMQGCSGNSGDVELIIAGLGQIIKQLVVVHIKVLDLMTGKMDLVLETSGDANLQTIRQPPVVNQVSLW